MSTLLMFTTASLLGLMLSFASSLPLPQPSPSYKQWDSTLSVAIPITDVFVVRLMKYSYILQFAQVPQYRNLYYFSKANTLGYC